MGLKSEFVKVLSGKRPVSGNEDTATLVAELAKAFGSAGVVADVLDMPAARVGKLRKGTAEATDTERAALVAAVRRARLPRDLDPAREVAFHATDHHGKQVVIKWQACEVRDGTWEAMVHCYLLGDLDGMVNTFVRGITNEWYVKVFRTTWAAERRGEVD